MPAPGYHCVPFTFPVTIVPAVAPGTDLRSPRPLFGRIASVQWYTQWYWPLVLDQTEAGEAAGHYDRLLVDRNHDGDMADEGECVEGRLDAEQKTLCFEVGDLYLNGKGQDRTFQLRDLVVRAEASADPAVTFTVAMDHRMFGESSYTLTGPYGTTLKLSPDVTRMPTVNLTAEIATGPDFKGRTIRLLPTDLDQPFRIGQERPLRLVCLTGDPRQNEHVLAVENAAFAKPVRATLVYIDAEGVTRGREFELGDWRDGICFAGAITVPPDATPGAATLVVNFRETLESRGMREMHRHFTQLVHRVAGYVDADGKEHDVTGFGHPIELTR